MELRDDVLPGIPGAYWYSAVQIEGTQFSRVVRFRSRNQHEMVKEPIEFGSWICTETSVHGTGLDDRAGRRSEPVPAFGQTQFSNRATGWFTVTDGGDEFKVRAKQADRF